jgi:hypothetical protein
VLKPARPDGTAGDHIHGMPEIKPLTRHHRLTAPRARPPNPRPGPDQGQPQPLMLGTVHTRSHAAKRRRSRQFGAVWRGSRGFSWRGGETPETSCPGLVHQKAKIRMGILALAQRGADPNGCADSGGWPGIEQSID